VSPDRACARSWEAEAVEDGELTGADRASFQRHVATCETCARAVEALRLLGQTINEFTRPQPSALALRRMRLTLLQRAHQQRTSGPPRRRAASIAIGFAAIVAVLTAWAVGPRLERGRPSARTPPSRAAAASVAFDVTDLAGAIVTSTTAGGVTRAVLSEGAAAFRVDRVAPGLRFLLTLPDGEIEVRGTRFVVNVRDARTQSVEVTEGMVLLRLRGEGETPIGRGEHWAREAPSERRSATIDVPIASQRLLPLSRKASSPTVRSPPPNPPAADAIPAPSAPSLALDEQRAAARERFAAAMAAFQSGRYAEADVLFDSFGRAFPNDARREDTAFLRAVCHARMGDWTGAESLARAYLGEFPSGLRRPEAEQLVDGR
jgi:FecR protein/Putative zinc-finger